ncbi:MAG: FecR family protein [Petrotogales bacterium]
MAKKSDIKKEKESKTSKVKKSAKITKTKTTSPKEKKEALKPTKSKTVKTDEKEGKETKPRSKSMKKRYSLIILTLVVICIIGLVWFIINSDVVKAESKAQLIIDSGVVQVKHEGDPWIPAQNGMLLYQSDSVKTGDNTSASIILFDNSIIIRLDSSTEVTLQEVIEEEETSVKMEQEVGRTWNTISKMSGIDSYEVQTPTAVASVRGTAFEVNVSDDGNTTIGVGNGTVNVSNIQNGTVVDTVEINENKSVTVGTGGVGQTKPYEKDEWVEENQQKDEELKKELKDELYSRIEPYIPELKEYGMTDEEIDALIEGYLQGYLELPPETPDWVREIFEFS